jgi:hypothetical protein
MADTNKENARFRKEKTPIIRKYLADHTRLFAEIAGRGFLMLPGYAADAETELELAAKLGLSEVNYKILSETIERELKQVGIDYNLAYKVAALAWEVEKQEIIAAWDSELAWIKRGMAEEEEIKMRLALEVAARQAVLIDAKTAIELEMEGYRLTLAELEDDTAAYEVQLANAKLLTAQKKLELIPILQEICTKEEALLALEEDKAAELAILLNAKRENAGKRALLIPWYEELANLNEAYANLIPGQIAIEEQIADEKLAQAAAVNTKEENKLTELEKDIETANKEVETSAAKRSLRTTQFNNEQTLIKSEIDKDNTYQNEVEASYGRIIADERATKDEIISEKADVNNTQNEVKLDSARTLINADIAADRDINNAAIYEDKQVAEIKSAEMITASLTHLIG